MNEKLAIKFEQITSPEIELGPSRSVASTALRLGEISVRYARVERVPRYPDGERENDAEHSLMLALVATELAAMLELDLDPALITQYAVVHDLIEIKTGDVATFALSADALAAKEQAEQEALAELIAELPPYTAKLLGKYEAQADREARFVRAVDKLLPLVIDIIGDGARVMQEDYNVTSPEALNASHLTLHQRIAAKFHEFPEIIAAHQQLCELFEQEFFLSVPWQDQSAA